MAGDFDMKKFSGKNLSDGLLQNELQNELAVVNFFN